MSETTTIAAEEGNDTLDARQLLREQNEQSLVDYLEELQGESSIRVTVIRETPKIWKGRPIEGTLETFDEPVSETEIRDHFGGGKYRLKILTPNKKGSFRYAAHRTVKIAGDPKLDHLAEAETPTKAAPNVVRETLRLSERMVDRAHLRADRAEERAAGKSEMDPSVELLVRGLQEELRELRRASETKDARIHELITNSSQRGPTDSLLEKVISSVGQRGPTDTLLEKVIASVGQRGPTEALLEKMVDTDSARIAAIRTQHDAEIRTTRERHLGEIDRLFGRSEESAKRQAELAAREANTLRSAYDGRIEALKLAHESSNESLRREIAHLERELSSAKTEVGQLRAKKNKSVIDSVSELAAVKEALGSFGDDGSSTVERVLSALMASPLLERLGSARPALPAPPQPALLQQSSIRAPMPTPSRPTPPQQATEDIGAGLEFMETAFANNVEAESFATTARSVVPADVLSELARSGPDVLISQIVASSPHSPLVATQRAKNWLRAVVRCIVQSPKSIGVERQP